MKRVKRVAFVFFLFFFPFFSLARGQEPLTLSRSIEIALERSPTLQAAREAIREAEYRRKAALSAFFPQVETQYSYTRLDEKPTFTIPGLPPREVGPKDNYNWIPAVTQHLLHGGALRKG